MGQWNLQNMQKHTYVKYATCSTSTRQYQTVFHLFNNMSQIISISAGLCPKFILETKLILDEYPFFFKKQRLTKQNPLKVFYYNKIIEVKTLLSVKK
jgi:hypothetical protein